MLRILMPLLLCAAITTPVLAEDHLTDTQRAEEVVRVNANGLMSITYQMEWPWEKSAYVVSLYNVLNADLKSLNTQCAAVKQSMLDDGEVIAGPNLLGVTKSMFSKGEIHQVYVMNGLLKKYSGKYPVDEEKNGDGGKYKPLMSSTCNSLNKDENGRIGMMQQMFYTMTEPFDTRLKTDLCGGLQKAAICLRDIFTISESRHKRATKEIEFGDPDVLMNAWLVR